MPAEIERKWLVRREDLPCEPGLLKHKHMEQYYLCTDPVLRVRRENDEYFITYKGSGRLTRTECSMPVDRDAFERLKNKAEGAVIIKDRYYYPLEASGCTAEVDIFSGRYEGLIYAEVEFESESAAEAFVPPSWFGAEVTFLPGYSNAELSRG